MVQGAEFAAGRINASSGGAGTDVWYYTRDHLGSTRLITDAGGAVKERSDYYPFGLRMEGGTQASGNRWRFAGKEEQKAGITLDWLNFGARMYDPCLGRWTTQDPLAEKYPGISSYAYCAGNPMNLVDPDGMRVRPKGFRELEMIKNTLPKESRKYVKFDSKGFIDSKNLLNYKGVSMNYARLRELVDSDYSISVILSETYDYI